ncbi:sodium:proton antiporter [bacterium DOLJORAL78_65_58]|nr:MAG: sodium:proton antiporter [bacterium DOLZORAL124_64_63]PIE75981.1 MAG: sodium:proton antiporter [bacterium DOLJORAL78_65_58]
MSGDWLSVIPPVLAIGLALLTRQVLVALLLGVWAGALIVEGNVFFAFLRVGDTYLLQALADRDHAAILLFTTILGGMVGVLSRSGATEGIVHWLSRRVRGRRGGMVSTAAMGTLIFFDDYANTLLVGSTMRPLSDRLRISREKLAWLVDSTAAPVTTVAVISTWVGFEVGLIQDAMAQVGQQTQAYTFFLQSLPYSYYPILTLLLVYLLSATGRDFGPMLNAERRALQTGQVLRPGSRPASDAPASTAPETPDAAGPVHPLLAGIPILAVILTTALGLYFGGRQGALAAGLENPSLRAVLNHADSFTVLTWAALTGAALAVLLSCVSGRLNLNEAMTGYLDGARAMLIAVTILVLAWSLSAVCAQLDTAGFLVEVSRQGLSARVLPAVVFILAAAVSFATGTSWGTMAILMPLVYPLGLELPVGAGLAPEVARHIHLAGVSAVLAGAVFGDHCSPISDTTIMSSLACGSDHVDHVRTQLPYSLTTGALAVACGYLPVGLGVAPWLSLLLGAGGVVLVVWRLGQVPDQVPEQVPEQVPDQVPDQVPEQTPALGREKQNPLN